VWWNANGPIAANDMPRTTHVTDTRLVRRSQQGDRRAFRALLARYDRRLRGLAYALLLDPSRVDAVLRVAYMKAWREVVRIDAREDAAAWLYRAAYNACIDALRRDSTRIGAAPPSATDAALDPGTSAPAGNQSGAPQSDGQVRVAQALAGLASADRVAVVLVDREGFSPPAAARILGLTTEVVETRLAGARARLSHQLGADVAAASGAEEVPDEPEVVEIRLDDAASDRPPDPPDPTDAKVATRTTAGPPPNGSGRGNGSDGSGGTDP
jgi:RNA polymerase sigma factor (sigma-70 family)